MYDYTQMGDLVHTPIGPGRYLEHKNGKVLVVMDFDTQPVEFDEKDLQLSFTTKRIADDDMYEALKKAEPFIKHLVGRALGPADIDSEELYNTILRAIAKAEGRL